MRLTRTVMALTAALVLASAGSGTLRAQGGPQLPPQAARQAEAQFEGELEVQVEDADTGSRLLHFLHVGNQRLRLKFAGERPELETGVRIRARGIIENDTLELSPDPSSVQVLTPAPLTNTFGEQRTIVILINFTDKVLSPYTSSSAYTTTFTSTSDFFMENSYGQTWLTGDVFGWFTIPMNSTSCDTNTMSTLADQAATAAGVNLSQYTRKVYAFPQISACTWWGLGSVGGSPSRAWINGTYSLKVVAHELGHNFGNYHSRSVPCDSTGCKISDYGDLYDVMGNPSSGHMTAFQKERLGWLNYGTSPLVLSVTAPGPYVLDPYEFAAGSNPKALRILKSVDANGWRTWYYVEVRTKAGFDSSIATGVLVHTGSESAANSSDLIDLQAATTTFDGLLDAGQSFTDAALGLTITAMQVSSSGATVDVSYGPLPCVTQSPTVTLSPGTTQWRLPGAAATYTMTVVNRDSSTCAPVTFNLSMAPPAGWSTWLSPAVIVDLAPGAQASAQITIASALDAVGLTTIVATASRATGGAGASATASMVIASALDTAISVATSPGNNYTFTQTVAVGSMPVSGASVTFVITSPTGKVTKLTATTTAAGVATAKLKLKPADSKGTYSIVATAAMQGIIGAASGAFVY